MENSESGRALWRFSDGAVSISASMLLSLLLAGCACEGIPVLGYLAGLTQRENGVIIVATLLLFPTTLGIYGVFVMFFAAKEAVERRATRRGRTEGRAEGIVEGRAEGIVEGRAEGIVEGRAEGIVEGRAEGIVEGRAEGIVEGRAEGIVEGRAEGIVEGRAEGIVEGIEEGRRAERERIARMLAEYGVDVSPEFARKLNGSNDDAETNSA